MIQAVNILYHVFWNCLWYTKLNPFDMNQLHFQDLCEEQMEGAAFLLHIHLPMLNLSNGQCDVLGNKKYVDFKLLFTNCEAFSNFLN